MEDGALMTPAAHSSEVITFGPFTLVPGERLLTKAGIPVELGGRALDILIALTSRPNETLSKNKLLDLVWPGVTVEETSLRFHMASLRKGLGDGKDGARYIATLTGRGYCFVAPVSRSSGGSSARAAVPYVNLPPRLTRMVGRGDDTLRLSNLLNAERFITIVGTGGIGKTTVAVAVGNDLIEAFAGAVLFVDLGMLSDPKLVPSAVASLLGLSVQSDDATPSLIAYLRENRVLLILDTCEHLIEAVAPLAFRIFNAAPQVHILATLPIR
jgi:DNA-binding winged helix-turn-helix (wHTH) protein